MRNSRKLLPILVLFLLPALLWAGGGMKIIPLSSPIYDYVDALYQMEGLAAPQGARPWTNSDLEQQLSRVEATSEPSKEIVAIITDYLGKDESGKTVTGGWNLSVTPAIGYHTNTKFDTQFHWANPVFNNRLLGLNANFEIKDYFAANMGFSLSLANSTTSEGIAPSNNEPRFRESFSTNIPFVPSGSFNDIEMDFTDNSFVSAGNQYISLTVGRGRLSWGNGLAGNLLLGDTLPYHDYVNISASNNTWFDYNMLISFFTHPMNFVDENGDPRDYDYRNNLTGIQFLMAHRFEFRMLSDKLRLTVNEAVMYQSEENYFDYRLLNPILIMHGYYMPANANSLLTVELEWAPTKTLQLYLSFGLDDFSVPGEPKAPEEDSTLNMLGVMGGARITKPLGKGYFNLTIEGVYTSPLMYHKGKYNNNVPYSLDYVGTVRLAHGTKFYRQYLSFPFGSDAAAITIDAKYTVPYKWEAGASLFLMAHGITKTDSLNGRYGEGTSTDVPSGLTTSNPFDGKSGEISYTCALGLRGTYYFMQNLSISSSLDFIVANNFENKTGTKADMQITLTFSYSIF